MTIKNYCVLLVCHLFITSGLAKAKILVVDQSGSGDYVTVQAAFDAIPGNNKKEVIIYVKNGVYQEKLHLDKGKNKQQRNNGIKNTLLPLPCFFGNRVPDRVGKTEE